jgi:hypothetical protein
MEDNVAGVGSVIHQPIFAEPFDRPAWFVLIVPPQSELVATAWLARHGVEAWHPRETVYVHARFKPHKLIPKIKPICTGYLFARFTRRPVWDFLFAQSHGKIRDVMRIGERPVAIGEAELMVMQEVPERLRALRQAAIDAATIRPGDMATITGGHMDGWTIRVDSIKGGMAYFEAPIGKGSVVVERLQK